jgi:hypothetical protein
MTDLDLDLTALEPKARPTLPAAEALARLQAGKPLEHVRVERLCLRGVFPAVAIKNCTLVRPAFDRAVFQGEVAIIDSTLDRPVVRDGCVFEKGLNLTASVLVKAMLVRFTIKGCLNLSNAVARGKLLIADCTVEGKVRAWELRAEGWLDFKDCAFGTEVDLRSIHVDQGLNMRGCKCAGDVLLRGAVVCKKLELTGSAFAGLLDLSKAKLNDYVYLEGIEAGPGQRFAFLNTVAERLLVLPAQVEGRLASEERGAHGDAMQEYGVLKRAFQNLHRYEHEDWAFYRFKVNQRRAVPRAWLRPWTQCGALADWLFLDLGCGYGTNPYRAVRAAAGIVLGFALIYFVGIDRFYIEKKPFPDLTLGAWPNRLFISVMLSVSVFISGLTGIRDLAQGWMNVPLVVEAVLGTLLWGLFIVAFSRKVIR